MKKRILYWVWLGCLAGTANAQMPPANAIPTGNRGSSIIQSEIDQLLRVSESDIMAGLKDAGLDYGELIKEKVMDEVIKGIADATVLAPFATEIMEQYQKQKNKDLAKAIEKLKRTWKDGQERINKVRYQDFKVKYAYQQAMNKAPMDVMQGTRRQAIDESVKALWTDGLPVAITITDPTNARLMKEDIDARYPNEDIGWTVLASARSSLLADDKTLKAKMALVEKQGQTAYLSPADRLRLLREIDKESKARRTTLLAMDKITSQGLDYYKYQRNRKAYQTKYLRTQSYR
ncbi:MULTISPECIES: hypothetical protein [Spirosoma]|uniref:Peptidylprolyl isomerase n=1 Tax=Spirosoma liriopis TaxID=2937440 RepID=A0ABT0HTU0_9BACT|nr:MULTISPECIES: hypothetical protein [Spirosoma]MCK8495552.1 hypothetical protein [Spirosoma liriopis]UHG94570.1 hypothetical protein LQ777_27860 [Spirosoma oryzicola]